MKNYLISVFAPAFADITITVNSEKEALRLVKDRLKAGMISATLDPEEADFADYYAEEMPGISKVDTSHSHFYKVRLKATAIQDVPVLALSKEEAEEKVMDRYLDTDELDFSDEDVVGVDATALPLPENEEMDENVILSQLVRIIRNLDASDEQLAGLLRDAMQESLSYREDAEI